MPLTNIVIFEILRKLNSHLLPTVVKYLTPTVTVKGIKQMRKKWFLSTLLFLISLSFTANINAAELRGRLIGLPGATLAVNCTGGGGSSTVSSDGSYAIMGLPSGQGCSFTVSEGGAISVNIPFSTSRSVTIYNGQLRKHGSRILVIRE